MKKYNNKINIVLINSNLLFKFFLLLLIISNVNIMHSQISNYHLAFDSMISKISTWQGIETVFAVDIKFEKANTEEHIEGIVKMKDLKFTLTSPDLSVWYDSKTYWIYTPRNKEVNINNNSEEELSLINPLLMLKNYKKKYNLQFTGESTSVNAKIAYDFTLTPKSKDVIEKINIQIEKNTFLPIKISVLLSNGMYNTIVIRKIYEISVTDDEFVFPVAKYPDVEIIDLR